MSRSRVLLAAALIAVVLPACGRFGQESRDDGSAEYGDGGGSSGPGGPADPSGPNGRATDPGGDAAVDEPGEGASGSDRPQTPGQRSDPGTGNRASQPDAIKRAAVGPPGALARAILRPDAAARIVLEVQAQSGASPHPTALEHLKSTLSRVSNKPLSAPRVELPGGAKPWSPQELVDLADAQASTQQGGGQAVLRILFLHGSFQGNRSVLGVAVRADVAAVFVDQVEDSSFGRVTVEDIQTSVSAHELGHLLGLVDLARDTGRDDPDHPGHSTNSASVMYWAVESNLIGQLLGEEPPTEFDRADLDDLDALRHGG